MCTHANAALRALSLSEGGATPAVAACARRAAPVRVGICSMEAHFASKTASLPRGKTVLRRASRGLHRAAGVFACAHT